MATLALIAYELVCGIANGKNTGILIDYGVKQNRFRHYTENRPRVVEGHSSILYHRCRYNTLDQYYTVLAHYHIQMWKELRSVLVLVPVLC